MAQLQPRTLSLSPTHHHPPHVTIPHSLCVFIEDYDLAADELFPYEEEEGQVCHSYSCSHALSLSPSHHHPPHVTIPPSACLGSSADRLHTGGTALTVPR